MVEITVEIAVLGVIATLCFRDVDERHLARGIETLEEREGIRRTKGSNARRVGKRQYKVRWEALRK